MTPALEQIEALPAKWREQADQLDRASTAETPYMRAMDVAEVIAYRAAAADLDTALQALRDEAGKHGAADHGDEQASKATLVPCDCGCGRSCCACCGTDLGFIRPTPAAEAAPQAKPTVHVGAIGHVDHSKTTLTAALTKVARMHTATPPSAPAVANADRMAIKLLVAAGFITEAKANEALNIAHGFDKGPLSAPVPQEGVTEAMVREVVERHVGKTSRVAKYIADDLTAALAGALPQGTTWPNSKEAGRIGDMSTAAVLRVGLDSDNDVYVTVSDERGFGSVEFCTPGSGGGKSPRVRDALIALMVAIEGDNAETPDRDWWARRLAAAPAQGVR